jgi:hypothetical protein
MPIAYVLDENLRGKPLWHAIRHHNRGGATRIDATRVGDPADRPLRSLDRTSSRGRSVCRSNHPHGRRGDLPRRVGGAPSRGSNVAGRFRNPAQRHGRGGSSLARIGRSRRSTRPVAQPSYSHPLSKPRIQFLFSSHHSGGLCYRQTQYVHRVCARDGDGPRADSRGGSGHAWVNQAWD